MTTIWILNTIGLLATTVGVLVVFLHLHRTSRTVSTASLPEVAHESRLGASYTQNGASI